MRNFPKRIKNGELKIENVKLQIGGGEEDFCFETLLQKFKICCKVPGIAIKTAVIVIHDFKI